MKKQIAFFDFDGTITTRDTLLEYIKYSKGHWLFYLGFLLNSFYLIAYKVKIISNEKAKEKILRFFFKNMPFADFEEKCEGFSATILPGLIRPKALKEIKELQNKGFIIVIVSASPENWIQHLSNSLGVKLIATRLELENNLLTGNIFNKNCHGDEKVLRIRKEYELQDYETIYAYGDSSGDEPMLRLATHSFYKPFK